MSRARLLVTVALLVLALAGVGFLWHGQLKQARRQAALTAARTGNFLEAEPQLKLAALDNPGDVPVLASLAKGYLALERKGDAYAVLNRWLAEAPGDGAALELRLELRRDLGEYDQALADLDQLSALNPSDPALKRRRPGLLFSAGRFAEAQAECLKCLEAAPHDRGLLRLLAQVYRSQKAWAPAAATLDRLLLDDPNDPAVLMGRATLFFDQGEPGQAIPLFRQVLALDPNRRRTARYQLSLALARVNPDDAEARRLMDEVRRMQDAEVLLKDSQGQPDNLPLQVRTARALFENQELANARAILQRVLSRDPDQRAAHTLLADVYDRLGQFDLAADHRRRGKTDP